jgi:hypothetical protein
MSCKPHVYLYFYVEDLDHETLCHAIGTTVCSQIMLGLSPSYRGLLELLMAILLVRRAGIATGYGLGDQGVGFSSPGGDKNFHFSMSSRPNPRPTQTPTRWKP